MDRDHELCTKAVSSVHPFSEQNEALLEALLQHGTFDRSPLFEQVVLWVHTLGDQMASTLQNHLAVVREMNPDVCAVDLLLNDQRLIGDELVGFGLTEMLVIIGPLRPKQVRRPRVLDEGHRGQYGEMHAKMRKVLPNACFIAFTGTPVMKKEKHTIDRFGGLIEPAYTIRQAVDDKAVVPLLYEGRHVEQKVEKESIDDWFDRLTDRLSKEQCADLKKKFTTTDQLNKAQQKVMRVAWDISVHYRDNWQGTPFKAQLVTQDKSTALLYKKFLDEFGMVTSEVLISGPDTREGNEEVEETNPDGVQAFWKKMMTRFSNEDTYNKQIINAFKHADEPEIIIVVDKLLTGFDAPRNTVLYLTRKLKDHTLLQAIARVNRLCEGKEFGYIIDYRGVLKELDSALDLYSSLAEFEKEDLAGTLTDVSEEVRKLPEKHSQLWDVFNSVRNKKDEEAYERLLGDEELSIVQKRPVAK